MTSQPVTIAIPLPAGGVKLTTFIPWTLVKRGMKKEIITPLDVPEAFPVEAEAERRARNEEQLSPLARALGLAHYWQQLLDEGKFASLTEIAKAEGLGPGYVSRVLQLNRLAPELVADCLAGNIPIALSSLLRRGVVALDWDEQRRDFI
jgi:hypothetical protein